jgi:hypothetical protein
MCDELSVSETTLVSTETGDVSLTFTEYDSSWEMNLLGYYSAGSGNFLPMFRDKNPNGFLTPEDGAFRLSQNVGKKLPPLTV